MALTTEPETVLAAKFSIPHAVAATTHLHRRRGRSRSTRCGTRIFPRSGRKARALRELQPWPKDRPAPRKFRDGSELSALSESARGGADCYSTSTPVACAFRQHVCRFSEPLPAVSQRY
jgi:hypothetical protein